MTDHDKAIEAAAKAVRNADALLIGAGAGMGVDSGLPDFRGNQGFWRAYPPFKEKGLSFVDMANPRWFGNDPEQAWGFYGHRLHLYRRTSPHRGFEILRQWGDRMSHGSFVFTSNVDGQFQMAGFDDERVAEVHGSIHHLQCSGPCSHAVWKADGVNVDVDEKTFIAQPPLPRCDQCGGVARPNILMFGDWSWLSERTGDQERQYEQWLRKLGKGSVVLVECGAGTAVPSVRMNMEAVARSPRATLIRINPREPFGPAGTISLPLGALEALDAIDTRI